MVRSWFFSLLAFRGKHASTTIRFELQGARWRLRLSAALVWAEPQISPLHSATLRFGRDDNFVAEGEGCGASG
jgi:hypothetical protein